MYKPLFILAMFYCLFSCHSNTNNSESEKTTSTEQDTLVVDFWNGNRSEIRQNYESDILKAVLEATSAEFGAYQLIESREEYPGDEESKAFSQKNHDVLVTVAGNQKFKTDEVLVIAKPLAKNLLGYRVPIIQQKESRKFANITDSELKKRIHGIPNTWSDVAIFRFNEFAVSEEGNFDDIFDRLAAGNFDYTTFGANEVINIFENRASKIKGLSIEDNLLLFYPFPLVFYINPNQIKLAKRIETGLAAIENNGTLNAIFKAYYGTLVEDLNLKERQLILLKNPLVPKIFVDLKPDLIVKEN